jgi:hypothetical protein
MHGMQSGEIRRNPLKFYSGLIFGCIQTGAFCCSSLSLTPSRHSIYNCAGQDTEEAGVGRGGKGGLCKCGE